MTPSHRGFKPISAAAVTAFKTIIRLNGMGKRKPFFPKDLHAALDCRLHGRIYVHTRAYTDSIIRSGRRNIYILFVHNNGGKARKTSQEMHTKRRKRAINKKDYKKKTNKKTFRCR